MCARTLRNVTQRIRCASARHSITRRLLRRRWTLSGSRSSTLMVLKYNSDCFPVPVRVLLSALVMAREVIWLHLPKPPIKWLRSYVFFFHVGCFSSGETKRNKRTNQKRTEPEKRSWIFVYGKEGGSLQRWQCMTWRGGERNLKSDVYKIYKLFGCYQDISIKQLVRGVKYLTMFLSVTRLTECKTEDC